MKKFLRFILKCSLFFMPSLFCSQIQVSEKEHKINIDLDLPADSIEVLVSKGKYDLTIISKTKVIENLFLDKKLIKYPSLGDSITTNFEEDMDINNNTALKLNFHDNTDYVITIKLENEITSRKYILRSKSDFTWKTSFGVNAIVLTQRSRFVNSAGIVQQKVDNNQFDLIPSIMFTFMNFQQNWSWGFTAGLGTDFKKISVFTGPSLGIGQNVIITAGIALHEQLRPDSNFSTGQIIEPTLADDKLNKEYYRINPFVGITFNLNSNPFKNKSSD